MDCDEQVSVLRDALCPANKSVDGALCGHCASRGQCRIAEKSDEQLSYVFSSIDDSIFLKACPGSGKTEVIALKAAYEINRWSRVGGLAVLTFTNNAADVIAERISQFTGSENVSFPHFVGTLDSWIHGYIANPFAHIVTEYTGLDGDRSIKLVDERDSPLSNTDSPAMFLNGFKLKTPYVFPGKANKGQPQTCPLYANNIRWAGGWEIRNPISNRGEFMSLPEYYRSSAFSNYRSQNDKNGRSREWITEKAIKEDFKTSKQRFWKGGFATYADVECLVWKLLATVPNLVDRISRRFPAVIVDECQDLSPIQLNILARLRNAGVSIHLVGDLNQAIYEFKKVDPNRVREFVTQHNFSIEKLTGNFRSCQPIVNLADQLVDVGEKQFSQVETALDLQSVVVSYDPNQNIADLPAWFEEFLQQEAESLSPEKCAIIARGWAGVSALRPTGMHTISQYQFWLATAIYLWKSGENQARPEAIQLIGRFLAKVCFESRYRRSKDQYRPEGFSSAAHWRLFLAKLLNNCGQHCEISRLDQNWSVWAKTVRDSFNVVLQETAQQLVDVPDDVMGDLQAAQFSFNAPKNLGTTPVRSSISLPAVSAASIPISTIHSVKGETFDAVMVVSAKRKSGAGDGHWENWTNDPCSEAARIAYVASTRPRQLLVWAVPNITDAQKDFLGKLGFQSFCTMGEDCTPLD